MATLTVGPGQQFATIDAAVDASTWGDTIEVQAGTYTNDWLNITHSLTLEAVGGMVVMTTDGSSPPNGKAMITEGLRDTPINVTISGFDISHVAVADQNGAAVRYEGGNLTLSNVWFHDNQEGLLGTFDPDGTITIDHSEFDHNGDGSGSTHDIYVGAIAAFTLTNSYIHDAIVGHEVKSRAANNTITNNRIFDNTGSASYSVDIPNGGNAIITGNVIEQGPNTQNPAILAYGEEGLAYASNNVTFTGNTIVNDRSGGTGVLNPTGIGLTSFAGNDVFNLANPLGGTVIAHPTLDLSPISFIVGAIPPPPEPPPAPPPEPPPTLPPPPPPPPPEPTPPPLTPLERYHSDVLADFTAWATTHVKLSVSPRVLAVLNTELNSTTVLGIIKGDKWSI